ncbi:MAG: hypothetical protein ACJ763_17810 [Bdellovibrionia bacterium]
MTSESQSNRRGFAGLGAVVLPIAASLLCLALQVSLNLYINQINKVAVPAQSENAHRWDPRLFKMISFGHLPAAIDWMWIQVLLDPNISHVAKGTHPAIYYTLDLITDLDPINFSAYKAGANLLAVVRDDGAGARDILEKGEKFRKEKLSSYPAKLREDYWGYSWGIPYLLVYVYMFELQDIPHAAVAIQEAAAIPGAPDFLLSMQKRLQSPGGEYEVGLRLLNHMIQGEKNEDAKDELIKKRNSLVVGQFLFEINHSFQNFLQTRSRMPGSLQSKFESYLKNTSTPSRDPWGGVLSVSQEGKIVTSTPHNKVFGLD